MIEFEGWPKTPRLRREITISEKIDGTNAAIVIKPFGTRGDRLSERSGVWEVDGVYYEVAFQSRKRIITPDDDNFGFADWGWEHLDELIPVLGVGTHYGEWYGKGIQRGYGMDHREFALFNTKRWDRYELEGGEGDVWLVDGLTAVPTLYQGVWDDEIVTEVLWDLRDYGTYLSSAGSAFLAEGICLFHSQSRQVYKVLLEDDHISKTEAGTR